jgi:hypothetical protein
MEIIVRNNNITVARVGNWSIPTVRSRSKFEKADQKIQEEGG